LIEISVESFGYGHLDGEAVHVALSWGSLTDTDLVFDIQNEIHDPNVDPGMKQMTGLNSEVYDHVMATDGAKELIDRIYTEILHKLPLRAPRKVIHLGIGCTGGRHRSVVIAREIGRLLRLSGLRVAIVHHHVRRPVLEGGKS